MPYIDGFVTPVLPGRRDDYLQVARDMAALLHEHGALRLVETLGDDVGRGERTDLYRAVAAEEGEELAFSWIWWPSKEARDAGWARLMADPRMSPPADLPFDSRRMIFGGFQVAFDSGAGD